MVDEYFSYSHVKQIWKKKHSVMQWLTLTHHAKTREQFALTVHNLCNKVILFVSKEVKYMNLEKGRKIPPCTAF